MLVTLFLSFFVIILGIILITYILSVVGLWKMFQKAGKPGWPSLIPIYNTYILCEITGVSPWWLVICFGAGFITAFIPFLGFLGSVVSVYFGVLLAISTARSFGKEDAYAIGIYLLPFVFYLIIGLGDSKYLGPKPMEDVIFHHFQGNSSLDDRSQVRYCSSCGSKVNSQAKYCANCGKEL